MTDETKALDATAAAAANAAAGAAKYVDPRVTEAIDYVVSRGYSPTVAAAMVAKHGFAQILEDKKNNPGNPDLVRAVDNPDYGDIGDVGEHGFVGDLGTNHPDGVPCPHLPPEEKEKS